MVKIWGNIIRKNKISASSFLSSDEEPNIEMLLTAIQHLCADLDIEMPVILNKHKIDIMNFSLVRFIPSDFMEKVDFQRFEIEIFIEKDKVSNL